MKTAQDIERLIGNIEADITAIGSQLTAKKSELRLAKIELWELTSGFKMDDDVLFDDRKKGVVRAKITALDTRWRTPTPEVTLYKKDSTLGERTQGWGLNNLRKA